MPPRKIHLDTVAVAGLLICCALWGLNQIAIKVSVQHIGPMTLSALRSLVTGSLLLLWCQYRGINLFKSDGMFKSGVLVGACYAATVACTYLGLNHTSASRFGVFLYISPFVVVLGMPLIEKSERLSLVQWLGLLVAFGGMGLAFIESFDGPAPIGQWRGDLMAAASGVFWAGTVLVVRATRLSQASPEQSLFYQLAFSFPPLTLACVASGESLNVAWTPQLIGLLAYQSVVVTFASMLLWYWLMRRYPASKMSVFTLLTPVFGMLAGVLILDDTLTLRLILALATVTAGLLLVNRRGEAVS